MKLAVRSATAEPAETPAAERPPGRRHWAHRVLSALLSLVVVLLAVGFAVAAVAVKSGKWEASSVLSGSMEPKLPTGSVVIAQRAPVTSLKVGDIVIFHRPDEPERQVVHRIVKITPSADGPVLETKGDANRTQDPWHVRPEGDTAWIVRHDVPYIGYVTTSIRTETGFRVLLGAAAVLIVGGVVVLLWRPKKPTPQTTTP
ncbi:MULTISPECIES: signal peptidase I [unclassified Streptomyces]|uniref:signal peptidase I n=1 Tax=unclassified Streptomyces TaxID=2593676 RepID=UPI0033BDF075